MYNNVYSQLLALCVLGHERSALALAKPYGFPSGSFSFTNLDLANATNHTQNR